MDYMAIFKGRRATRTTATDLIDRNFKVVAFDDVVWAPEELSVLEGSVKDYYENACITGTYGNREFQRTFVTYGLVGSLWSGLIPCCVNLQCSAGCRRLVSRPGTAERSRAR